MKVKDLTENDIHKSVTEIIMRMHMTVLTPSYRYRSFTKIKNGNKLHIMTKLIYALNVDPNIISEITHRQVVIPNSSYILAVKIYLGDDLLGVELYSCNSIMNYDGITFLGSKYRKDEKENAKKSESENECTNEEGDRELRKTNKDY